jgi:hypothetical protein
MKGFKKFCTVSADLSNLSGKLKKGSSLEGPYWSVFYRIGFMFGATELRAFILWDVQVSRWADSKYEHQG